MVLKAIDDEKREFTGIASTPVPDRVNDIMIPEGAKFTLPLPFLWQHDPLKPVGEIYEAKVTKNGIEVKGRIKSVSAPSQLAARLDEAWVSLREGLVRGLSIGFRPLKYAFLDSGGVQYDEWDWFELSGVTIPMNAQGTITSIKHFDAENRKAALGKKSVDAEKPKPSGVTEKKPQPVKLMPKEGKVPMNIAEQIKNFQNERAAKVAKMVTIMEKSVDDGESLSEDKAEEYDTLQTEIESIDKHLGRMEGLQKAQKTTAKAVDQTPTENAATESRQFSAVRVKQHEPKGVALARVVKCIGMSKGNLMQAGEIAEKSYSHDQRIGNIIKAAVVAGSTTNATWAGALIGDEASVFADFVEFLRPQTILGKFGQGNIPGLRRVPFRTPLIGQTSGGQGYWVGEGKAKPLTKFDFERTTLEPLKVANIAALTMEVLRDSSPSAELLVRDGLADALRARLDIDFIDPTKAASAGISPASITNGVTPIVSSGITADHIRTDVRALMATFIAANNAPTSGVWVMSATTALALSLMTNALGQSEFPGVTMNGGAFAGLPVIVSEYVPSDTAGGYVFLVNASDVYLADDGDIAVDMSDQASLEMSDTPTQNGTTPTSSTMVSLWQNNLVGFRAERTINYSKRRASAVAVLSGVAWGA